MTLATLLLLSGLVLLIKGADLFVTGAGRLARGMGVSPLAVGLTVVAFGTSLPELFINLSAAWGGHAEIAVGNVVGSNTANMLLVLGIASLIRPLALPRGLVWKTIPLTLLAATMLWAMASDVYIDGALFSTLSRVEGLALLGFFGVFLGYGASVAAPVAGLPEIPPVPPEKGLAVALRVLLGFCGLLLGGGWVVGGAVLLGKLLAIPRETLGLTVVALGSSLPELAASVTAARRGQVELAVGTVVGAHLFNIFFVLGVSALIRPLPFSPAINVDMGAMVAATLLPFIFMYTGRVRLMGRREGLLALGIYLLYLGYLLYPIWIAGRPPTTID